MADRATADVVRERDSAMRRLQILAAEIRAHEEAMRRSITPRKRPADERLYRALRQVNDGDLGHGDPAATAGRKDAGAVELEIRERLYAPRGPRRRRQRFGGSGSRTARWAPKRGPVVAAE